MFQTVALLFVALARAQAYSIAGDVADGSSNYLPDNDVRMIGSEIVATNENLFTFELQIKPFRSNIVAPHDQPPVCTGVLLSNGADTPTLYALTSARCALAGDLLYISAGATKNSSAAVKLASDIAVSSVIVHQDFLRDMQTADLAIIPLPSTSAIALDDTTITAARLPSIAQSTSSYLTQGVTMAGWGYPNDVYLANSPTLRQLTSWVVPNWYCTARNLGLPIKSTHICTAGLPNKGPCTGDAGAPLILRSGDNAGTVIGLATYTPNRGCSRGRPGVFTRITSYLSWIAENTGIDFDNQ